MNGFISRTRRMFAGDWGDLLAGVALAVLGVAAVVGLILGAYWLMWQLWLFVVPSIWPDGPASLVRPDYWLFVGAWILVTWLGRAVFGSRSKGG